MDNRAAAAALRELRTRLELLGEDRFKFLAYERAAETLDGLARPIAEVAAAGQLADLPGIGKAIASKLGELLATGQMTALEKARLALPAGVLDVARVAGLGPKKVRAVWEQLGVTSLAELEYACLENRLLTLPGFGAKTQQKVLAGARFLLSTEGRHLLADALATAELLCARLATSSSIARAEVGGAVRHGHEVVSELVLVVAERDAGAAAGALGAIEGMARDDAGAGLVWRWQRGWRVLLRPASEAGFALAWLTASAGEGHVERLREIARERGTTVEEAARGLEDDHDVYVRLGLPPVPPELRESATIPDAATIEALVGSEDIGGSLHNHSRWSDGTATIEEMVAAARRHGYVFHGISDHSQAAFYANGLDASRLAEQGREIDALRGTLGDFRLFRSMEVDILEDGSLDLDDASLASLDYVVASVHSRFHMSSDEMTRRLVRAVSHPLVTILGHPTGRLLLGREGYTFDLDTVARAAAASGTALEINASPHRLDLCAEMARRAVELGCEVAINPDAHAEAELGNLPLGVIVARRAGIQRERVINARDAASMEGWLRQRKEAALALPR